MKKYNIAIVGINHLTAKEILKVLEERNFPVGSLKLFVTDSVGERYVLFSNANFVIDFYNPKFLKGMDIIFFIREKKVFLDFLKEKEGNFSIIGDSSLISSEKVDFPIVIPEINSEILNYKREVICSPSPLVIFLSLILKPFYQRVGISHLDIVSFHSASEGGYEEFKKFYTNKEEFFLIPLFGEIQEDNWTTSENLIISQIKKIFRDTTLSISLTSFKIPILYGISAVVNVRTKRVILKNEIKTILNFCKGIVIEENPLLFDFSRIRGRNEIFISRIREEKENMCGFSMYIMGDNLRKGSALNMVQIAEEIISRD
jgi:aspartate-semialdehyde dehydrogenase